MFRPFMKFFLPICLFVSCATFTNLKQENVANQKKANELSIILDKNLEFSHLSIFNKKKNEIEKSLVSGIKNYFENTIVKTVNLTEKTEEISKKPTLKLKLNAKNFQPSWLTFLTIPTFGFIPSFHIAKFELEGELFINQEKVKIWKTSENVVYVYGIWLILGKPLSETDIFKAMLSIISSDIAKGKLI